MSTTQEIQEAIAAERAAAKRMDVSARLPFFLTALGLYVGFLFLPYGRGVRGYELMALSSPATVMELVFVGATTLAMAATVVTVASKRTEAGWIAWMFSGFSFFASIWAFWALGFAGGASIGFFVAVLSDFLALVGFSLIAMRKTPEQLAAQERVRQVSGQLDEVGGLQRQAGAVTSGGPRSPVPRAAFVDDRRAQAAARYRLQQDKNKGAGSSQS